MTPDEWKLIDRFKEPSSWASLAAGLTAVGFVIPSQLIQTVSLIGAGVCVALGFFLKEQPHA
jgi:hypothetical protein